MIPDIGRTALVAALALAGTAGLASADEAVPLRIAHQFPQSHYLWEEGGKVFVDALSEDGQEIQLSVFPAAQLGRDPLVVVQSGLADIVTLVPSYTPEKLPLTSVSELPGFHNTTCEGTNRLWEIVHDGAPLDEAEYQPLDLHVLFVAHQPTYKILTARKQVNDLSDIAGLKLRANGASIGNLVRSVGGVPISMSSGEVYDAMMRGTIDGTLLPYYTLPLYGLDAVVDYAYEGPDLGGGPVLYAMTEKAWDALSDEMKARFAGAAAKAQEHLCRYQDALEAKDREDATQGGNVAITAADEADLAAWEEKFAEVATQWAEGMDRQGRPGSAILEAFRAARD